MKFTVALTAMVILALQGPCFGVELSETNQGIYIGIGSALNSQYPFPSDKLLVWCPFSDVGTVELSYPAPEFFVKVAMLGPDGKETPKTSLGEKWGAKFDGVKVYADVVQGWHMGSIEASGRYDKLDGPLLSGPVFARPEDWFKMEKPGIYTLKIEIQMFRIIKTPNKWSRQLLRFAPMKIKVEKPDANVTH